MEIYKLLGDKMMTELGACVWFDVVGELAVSDISLGFYKKCESGV